MIMERKIPKNVRQIGNVSDTPKIYVEDYVDTFFSQLCEKVEQEPIGAFLVGETQTTEEEEYVYIYGAIQMHDLKMGENGYILDEDAWKNAYEDCKQYFEDGEMLGWFVVNAGLQLSAENSTIKLHKKSFPKKNSVFIMKDSVEREEAYFVHKFSDLMEIGGHYTYYEKNPCMQNYMISSRKKNGATSSETVEDRAAKDFRSLVRTKEEQQSQKRANRLMYAASGVLILVVAVMGITTLNNFDKMKSVQTALSDITNSVSANRDSAEVQETDGEVVAVTQGEEIPDASASQPETSEVTDGGQAPVDTKAEEPQQPEGTPAGDGSDGVYVVESGDTLAIISRKTYGDVSHVESICKMNGITDGNLIYVGQKLLLP